MKGAYWQLFSKEIRSSKLILLLSIAAIVAWDIFLASTLGRWREELVPALAWMPIGLLYFYALFSGITSFSREWRGNHMYLMLSLPLRGWEIFGAKVLSTMCEIVLITIVTAAGASLLGFGPTDLVFRESGGISSAVPASLVYRLLFQAVILLWLSMIAVTVIGQFSYISSRMFERFNGLVTAWVLLLSSWGLARFMSIVTPMLRWLPDIPFGGWNDINGHIIFATAWLDSAPLVAAALWVVILFGIGSWLLERYVEI